MVCECGAQGTAFTYQGRLNANGAPANGTYDLTFALFQNPTGGGALRGPITNSAVSVSNGLFTTLLDFGPYDVDAYGRGRWLGISVRTNGSGPLAVLEPRQPMTPAPSAIYASYAGGPPPGGGFNADLLDGFDSAAFWQIGGNSGTSADVHFLGTTDNQALAVKVNNVIALQFVPGTTVPNLVGGLGSARPSVLAPGVSGAVIVGGNAPSGSVNGVGAGDFHAVYDNDGTVGGGFGNKAGSNNGDITDGAFATVAGGIFNSAANYAATVAGGDGNFAAGQRSFIGGGYGNQARAGFSTAGGGLLNSVSNNADYAVIGGGDNNSIGSFCTYGTIGGGSRNTIVSENGTAQNATVSGGTSNSISSFDATIGGGMQNMIEAGGYRGTIGGGEHNTIQYDAGDSTIAGGFNNTIGTNAGLATIGGGGNNRILPFGQGGTIPGGYRNSATNFAFAAGFQAKANHSGSFVWADLQIAEFSSTANNQFNIRAQGGVRLNTDTSMSFGNQTRQMLNLWGTDYGIGVQSSAAYFRTDQEFMWYRRGSHSDTFGDPGAGGTQLMRLGSSGDLIIAGTLAQGSDRSIKQDFAAVNAQEVLEKVAALPIQTWTYTNDVNRRHLGPVAQDFHAAFGLNGADDKHIATVDADGVALAAIQGLNQKLTDELKRRDAENAALKRELAELKKIVQQIAHQHTRESRE